jgi:hypothetical protein
MRFTRISQRGFLDTASVLILALRGRVWLGLNYLWVHSMRAMRSQVNHGVEVTQVVDQRLGGSSSGLLPSSTRLGLVSRISRVKAKSLS